MPVESRDDLAPCPFCGGTEISFGRLNNAGHLFAICNDCHARASAGESHADASKNWNTRPDAKRIAELERKHFDADDKRCHWQNRAESAERALAEERERCARIAERNIPYWRDNPTTAIPAISESFIQCATDIATAIRSAGKE